MHVVYKHTNKINGKAYIGYTGNDLIDEPVKLMESRWYSHTHVAFKKTKRKISNTAISRAIRKYGSGDDAWEHEVLEVVSTRKEGLKREIVLIALHETFIDQNKGYNMTPGGEGMTDLNPEAKETHRRATVEAMANPELRKHISDTLFVVMNTPETKKRNSDAQKIAQNKPDVVAARKIRNALLETKKLRSERSKKFHSDPVKSLNHQMGTAKANIKKRKPVIQYTLDGKFVAEYESIKHAATAMKSNGSGISHVINGRCEQAHGFIWLCVRKH